MKNIAALHEWSESYKDRLQSIAKAHGYSVTFFDNPADTDITKSEIILGNPSCELLPLATELKLLHLRSAGTDGYTDISRYANKDVILLNASGAYGLAISEWMLAMHLMLIKKLHKYQSNMANGVWRFEGQVSSVSGSTVLCVGVGDIGSNYAARVKSLGAYVIGVRRKDAAKPEFLDEVYTIDRLPELVSCADVISLSLPNTDKSRGIISEEIFARMKHGAIILNVGRGTAIDTESLCAALRDGRVGGAGLDVTDPEPLPPEHELWSLPNVLITPHISGGNSLPATTEMIYEMMCRNVDEYLGGNLTARRVDMKEQY